MEDIIVKDNRSKRRTIEIIVVSALIVIAAVVLGFKMNINSRMAKENALMSELRTARTAVQLYVMINKTLPQDLKTLVTETYTLGNKKGVYLSGLRVNKDDQPVDAFGNVLNYDPASGHVWSSTKKYNNW